MWGWLTIIQDKQFSANTDKPLLQLIKPEGSICSVLKLIKELIYMPLGEVDMGGASGGRAMVAAKGMGPAFMKRLKAWGDVVLDGLPGKVCIIRDVYGRGKVRESKGIVLEEPIVMDCTLVMRSGAGYIRQVLKKEI